MDMITVTETCRLSTVLFPFQPAQYGGRSNFRKVLCFNPTHEKCKQFLFLLQPYALFNMQPSMKIFPALGHLNTFSKRIY